MIPLCCTRACTPRVPAVGWLLLGGCCWAVLGPSTRTAKPEGTNSKSISSTDPRRGSPKSKSKRHPPCSSSRPGTWTPHRQWQVPPRDGDPTLSLPRLTLLNTSTRITEVHLLQWTARKHHPPGTAAAGHGGGATHPRISVLGQTDKSPILKGRAGGLSKRS